MKNDYGLCEEPPVPCDLKVGDRVTYTNEEGLQFPGMIVIGFSRDDSFYGRFIHIARPSGDPGAWWFPHRRDELEIDRSGESQEEYREDQPTSSA